MAELMLESKANGTWEYEILENKVKVKYKIKKGLNEIPESHIETLEADLGYKARVKNGTYKVLKGGKAITAAKKSSEKPVDDAKDLDEIKEAGKSVISDLKKQHKSELKAKNDEFTTEYQKLTDAKGEALRRVKELEKEKLVLDGQVAQLKAGSDKDLEVLKSEISDLKKEHDASMLDLMTENEKKVKTLEGEKGSLEKQVENLKVKVKELKAK